jgi:hypothetical protein
VVLDEGVGQSTRDERLPGDAEATGFTVDLAQEICREVHAQALDDAAGPNGPGNVHMSRQVNAGLVHGVELGGRRLSSSLGTLRLLHRVPA